MEFKRLQRTPGPVVANLDSEPESSHDYIDDTPSLWRSC